MCFDVDVALRRGPRLIAARFATAGGITVLRGVSGAGKTSILDMIAGLVRPDRGHVRLAGETLFESGSGRFVPPERRRIGYIFQDGRLFPHRRVRWNLLYGHRLAPPDTRWMTPDEAIGFLGIGDLLERWPAQLSGGEAQRVAIGRALLAGARALLMDEPLSALDPARREGILQVIEDIRDRLGLPTLYVTHDREEATRLAATEIVLD
ncbi:ATP-binding cassette domain-containing protein [Sphingomonas morindae]|uniref:ATP-binding cassette domain-containing protein n=1 Tax=Sphingomonas morindae TaxID=1541170 RepID=A0ABY4X6P6_9SPHN|nr:ATP-binding cassette domain-containing protein [Sphingomonas morindae]USI72571.1 ATP-binding cassette domain-containing protein [Sphingomonas morindae]